MYENLQLIFYIKDFDAYTIHLPNVFDKYIQISFRYFFFFSNLTLIYLRQVLLNFS